MTHWPKPFITIYIFNKVLSSLWFFFFFVIYSEIFFMYILYIVIICCLKILRFYALHCRGFKYVMRVLQTEQLITFVSRCFNAVSKLTFCFTADRKSRLMSAISGFLLPKHMFIHSWTYLRTYRYKLNKITYYYNVQFYWIFSRTTF